jgi:hypothetical protein
MASVLQVEELRGPTSGANANKVIIPAGQTLDASAGFTPPAGSVIQVVQGVRTTTFVIDSASYVEFLSATITPLSASSKILISATINGSMSANGSAFLSLFRGSSQIAIGTDANGNPKVSFALDSGGLVGDAEVSGGLTWLDSPNTTSSISYSIRGNRGPDGSGRLNINRSNNYPSSTTWDKNSVSSITLMEISG